MAFGKMENLSKFGLQASIALCLGLKLPDLDTHKKDSLPVEALLTAPQGGRHVRSLKMAAGSRPLTTSQTDGFT